jgi:hypothetical protein
MTTVYIVYEMLFITDYFEDIEIYGIFKNKKSAEGLKQQLVGARCIDFTKDIYWKNIWNKIIIEETELEE